ncbi:unnamed protein product, partial [Staurois parvus]
MDTDGDRLRHCVAPQPCEWLVLTGCYMTPSHNEECPAWLSICYREGQKGVKENIR